MLYNFAIIETCRDAVDSPVESVIYGPVQILSRYNAEEVAKQVISDAASAGKLPDGFHPGKHNVVFTFFKNT